METYTLSPAERRARAQALREQRENRYQYKKYFEEKAAIEQQQRQAELDIKNAESQRNGADFFTRTISTLGDVAGNIITGALKGIEGIYDLGAGIVGAVGGMFSDKFSEGVKNHIAYDAVGQWVGNPIAEMTKYSYIYDTSDTFQNITRGVASGVGQILPAVAVSILTAGAGAPAAIASLASSATFIAGAAGRGTEEAFNEGADFYQGLGYGILTGAVEGAIEKLSGGVSKAFMGKGLIDDVIKGATKKITSNAVAQKGLQVLIEAGGEGAEEWVAELVNPYLKRMTYNSEAELSTSKSRLEAALIGGLTSLAYSGSIGRIGAKSRNVSENLAEINTLKAKEENLWGNGKLDNEKATNIKTSIDNNYLEISKSLVKASEKSRANIIKKFKLESKFNADGTLVNEDVETVASNTQKPNLDIAGGQTNKDRQILKTQTTAEIKPLASPAAYNREAYSPTLVGKEVDLAFKPTIESLTDAQIKARQDFTKLNKGKVKAKLVFTNDLSVDSDGNIQDGAYKNGILYINTKANAAEVVVKHELSHFAEGTKAYLKYADFVLREINSNEAMTKKFGNLIEKINETSNLYKAVNQGKDISQEQREVLTEVIAQYTSENLFTNEEQINRLARVDRNFFQKVVDWFKDTIGNFQHKKNLSKEEKETVDFLKRAEKLYSKALGEAWGASDHTNYSLGKDKFDSSKKKRYNNYNQYDTLAKQWAFSPKTNAGDKKVLFNAKDNTWNQLIAEATDDGYSTMTSVKDTVANAEIIKNMFREVDNVHRYDGHGFYESRNDQSFYEIIDEIRTVTRSDRDDLYFAENGKTNGQDDGFYRRESQRDGNKGESNGNADIGKGNGTPKDGVKYSLKTNKDNLGNELTIGQQEYFKDTKVLDDNGNLAVVYHGTKQDFNVFNIKHFNQGSFDGGWLGKGFYFTNDYDYAESYAIENKIPMAVYLNLINPLILKDVSYSFEPERLRNEYGANTSRELTNVLKEQGYDGVILRYIDDYGELFIEAMSFESNQSKLTSNQNPTQNEDIRYSLSNGEVKKMVANKTKLKTYTKEDAEVIINGVMSHYMAFGDKYGDLSSKTKRQAITLLWEGLNTADKGYQAGIALDIANYIIENLVMEDIYADNDNTVYIDVVRMLKPYLHKMELSSLKGEIAHRYDKDKSVYALWGKRKGEKGYSADKVGQELLDFGMQIEATNEADIFFEIDSAYRKAINSLKKQAKTALKDIASAEELKKLKQDIAREILIGYDKQGTETAFGKTIKKYIKQIQLLKGQVKDLKERNKALNNLYESIDKLKGLEKYQKADIELADEVLGLIKLLKKVKTYRGNLSQNVRDIMIAYSKEVDGKKLYDIIANAGNGIDNPVAQLIEDIAHKNGDLSTQELRNLDLIMQNAIHNINNYDKVFFEGKTQEDAQIVEKAIKETKESKKIKDSGVGGSLSKFSRWLTAPIWRFQRLCSYRKNGIMSKVFTEFQNGVSRQAEFNMEVAEHYKEFFKKNKKVASDWNKATFDVGSAKLSRGQVMSLYMLSLREQAKGHLFNDKGGSSGTIRITDDTIANKGRFSEALIKGQDVTISPDVIDSIEKSLTLEEREFISLTQEFFNKIAKNAKVDTDMALFGISNAVEDNYIPIRVSDDQLYKQIGDEQSTMSFKSLFSVYTPSFNKDVKPNSKNKIVVENIMDIVNRHAKQMSAYYGLAVPVKTFNRLYNKTLDNGEKLSVEIAKMDSEFEKYVGKLLSDMQGNVKERTGFDRALGKIRGWGAKAALGLNLKVLANQFVSLPAAAIGVKYKSIAKGFTKAVSRKTDFDILVKYCPMLYDRFREGNNIDVGLLKENQGVLGKVDALTNLTTLPIGKIDKFVCGAVWNSCLEQTKNSTAYTNYSDEHYKAAAKLTEEVVIKTQANYLALYRPAILREQNSLLQLSTMFMSEPLQQFSLLASALDKIKVAKALLKNATASADIAEAQELLKNSKTEARHAITAVAIDSILLVLIAQAFKWVKGKEDDDKVEGIIGDFTENFVGMLPFVRDIYSLLQGYDVTNMAYSGLTNITNGAKEMYSIIDLLISGKAYSNSEITGGLRKTLLGISQTFGIPLRNLETYVKGIVEKFSPFATYKYDNFFYNKTSSNYTKDLRKAMDNGDEKLSDTILDLMLEEEKVGVKDSNTRKIIKDLYEQGFNVLPKSISTTITYDNEKIALTKNQLKQFKTIYEEASDKVKTLTQTDKFLAALPEVQAKSIKFVYDYYYNLSLEDLLGIDLESKNMLFAKAIHISDLSVVVSSIKDFETTIDKRGNTVQGSKKAKVQTYVNSLKLNAAQKYMLMGYCGYSNSKGDIRVKQYIQSLKLTKKQKETLFTMSGYEKSKA